jgi:hypothetical protein
MIRITLASSVMVAMASLQAAFMDWSSAAERTDEPASGAVPSVTPTPAPARRTHRLVYTCRDGKIASLPTSVWRDVDPAESRRGDTRARPAAHHRAEPAKASTRPAPQQASRARTLQETAECGN